MDRKMNRETDNIVMGACITLIVCALSGLLYFMFRRASLSPPHKPFTRDTIVIKKKEKKLDMKKNRKTKKGKLLPGSDVGLDKLHSFCGSYEHISEPSIQNLADMRSDSDDYSSSADDTSHNTESNSGTQKNTSDVLAINAADLPEEKYCGEHASLDLLLSDPVVLHTPCEDVDDACESSALVDSISNTSATKCLIASTVSVQLSCLKTKRPKRRVIKRPSFPTGAHVGPLPASHSSNAPHTLEPVEKIVETSVSLPSTSTPASSSNTCPPVDAQLEVAKLTEQLEASERVVAELSARVSSLSQENVRLQQKDEENVLGLHVLQQQYTELLRANRVTEHEKHVINVKLKNLEETNATLLLRLDQSNAESIRIKEAADLEARGLRDRLTEVQTKLSTRSATPPTPNSELIRVQELAQVMSSENHLLRSTLEQMKSELAQLHQTNRMQQQELQMYQLENRNFLEAQDTVLEQLRMKHNTEMTEASTRITAYEAQSKRECQEYETKLQKLTSELSETKMELSLRTEHEKCLSKVISSLEYQFAELTAEKQQLLEQVITVRNASEGSTSELLIQVAKLTSDLALTTAELDATRQRADSVTAQLDHLRTVARKFANIDVSIDSTQSLSSKETCCFSDSILGPSSEVQHLRTELQITKQQLVRAMNDVTLAQRQMEMAQTESECHKATLLYLEELLAKLQDVAEASENHWLRLLAASSTEQKRLIAQLEAVHSHMAMQDTSVSIQSPSLIRTQSAPSPPLSDNSLNTKNGSTSNELMHFADIETDCDIDTVLVGGTSFNLSSGNQTTATSNRKTIHNCATSAY